MPIYSYRCHNCKNRIEVIKSIHDSIDEICVVCATPMTREITIANFQLRGAGFHCNDYPKTKSGTTSKQEMEQNFKYRKSK